MTAWLLMLVGAAWLVPNHYQPWLSAWPDALAIGTTLLLLAGAIAARPRMTISRPLAAFGLVAIFAISGQLLAGKILFAGDGLMAALYIAVWCSAALVGSAIQERLTYLAVGLLFAAIVSVGIALNQWTGVSGLAIYAADLTPGGRPFGNVAQPNHLCTICVIAICCIGWLHHRRAIGLGAAALATAFMLLGMAMTQSRTGWLQGAFVACWLAASTRRHRTNVPTKTFVAIAAAFYASIVVAWPRLSEALLLPSGRTVAEQGEAGTRLAHWRWIADAITREPWWGYGWQQVGMAQQRVALDHPSVSERIEHSHNFGLDLLAWNGIPIGGLLSLLTIFWFGSRLWRCRDQDQGWMLAMSSVILIHGLLEYPLEYAYFLLPLGLAMGIVDSRQSTDSLRVPRALLALAATGLAFVSICIATEYFEAEENFRTLRIESARIGVPRIVTPAPSLVLLTQTKAFLVFAREEARPGLDPEQMEFMARVAARFGTPPVLFRYALAAGLNGQPELAARTLGVLCKIHGVERCTEARDGWQTLSAVRYPELRLVLLPPL